MYAVVKTGGKQYRVAEGDVIYVERLAGESGDVVKLEDVLALSDGKSLDLKAGKAAVGARILGQDRADKIVVFKKKRRQNYRRKAGHQQLRTVLKIEQIAADGNVKSSAAKAAPKAAAKPAAEKKAEAPAAKKPAAKKTTAKKDS